MQTAKMLEEIFLRGLTLPHNVDAKLAEYLRSAFVASVPIDVSDVTKYYYEGNDKDFWSLTKDFPNLAPPFKFMWLETSRPDRITSQALESGSVSAKSHGLPSHWAVLAQSVDVLDQEGWVQSFGEPSPHDLSAPLVLSAWRNTPFRWAMTLYFFVGGSDGRAMGPLGFSVLAIKEDGSIVTIDDNMPATLFRAIPATVEMQQEFVNNFEALRLYTEELSGLVKPLLLAICFMNCTNVELVETPRSRAIRRQLEKKDALLKQNYRTLVIEPMRKVLRDEGGQEVNGARKALHLVRGCFKDYRKSGLFGKHRGVYWWGPALRGNAEIGTVDKTYVVKAPV